MKNSDKENEQIMKQILENQEIDFQESDWEAAKMLIQNANISAPKKRRRFVLWIFFCVFSLGMLAFYLGAKEKENSRNFVAKKEILTKSKNENIVSSEKVKDSKSTISIEEKAEINAKNPKSERNLFPKNATQIAPHIIAKINSSIQNEKNAKIENILPENKRQNSQENARILAKTENTNPVLKQNKIFSKNIENQIVTVEKLSASNTTSLPQQKVLGIEKPISRLNSLFYAPQNIPILPDFPMKNNRFSLQIFGGIASTFPKNSNYKPAFYGGFQTAYQIHKNCKLLLFSELSSRNVQFHNDKINPTSLTPDISNTNYDYLITDTEPDISTVNTIIARQISISRNLLYYAGAGAGISIPYKRHELSLTAAFQKVIQTRSNYELQVFENGNLTYKETKKINNFTEGLNKQDVTFGIAYQYAINRNLQFHVSGNFGSKDMSNNAYYGNQIKDKNVQIRVGIAYRFWH
jgi:hypothetical protein